MTELTDLCLLCHRHQRRCVALCGDCRDRVTSALAEAPELYVRAAQGLAGTGHAMGDKLSQPRPGPRSPVSDGLLELGDDLARALDRWAAATKAPGWVADGPETWVRVGYGVQRCARVLTEYLTFALTAPYGVTHARLVLGLTAALRERLRLNALVHNLAAPCPRCNTRALIRRDGDDHVSCRLCGQAWPERHYALLASILVADAAEAKEKK